MPTHAETLTHLQAALAATNQYLSLLAHADTARRDLEQVLTAAYSDDTVPALHDAVTTTLTDLHRALHHLHTHLAQTLTRLQSPTAPPPPRSPTPPSSVTNRHGDHYPPEAAPYQEALPPRVRRYQGNAQMVGYIQTDGTDRGKVTATAQDDWTREVAQRLIDLGLFRGARTLVNHVEMKTVAIMLRFRAIHAQVVINHAPCGSEPEDRLGCHAVLADFIPAGRSLTVLGTDARGHPFRHTYEGRAPQ